MEQQDLTPSSTDDSSSDSSEYEEVESYEEESDVETTAEKVESHVGSTEMLQHDADHHQNQQES